METLMKNKKTAKQIAAIVCIVLLAALYLITLLSAIFAFPGWQRLFSGCLICTVAVPILLWIFIWLYGQFEQKHTIASFDIGQTARRTRTRQMLRRTKTQKVLLHRQLFPGQQHFFSLRTHFFTLLQHLSLFQHFHRNHACN